MTTIRDMRPGEGPGLEALQLRASLVWEQYAAQVAAHPEVVALPADGAVRVAEAGGETLGFSVVVAREDGAWELDGLFVEPERHGQGIGRALVEDVLRRARGRGVPFVAVVAGPATGFYEKLGFVVCGEATTQFGPAVCLRRAP